MASTILLQATEMAGADVLFLLAGFGTMIYLLYMTLWKKDARFQKLLTGINAAVMSLMLVALAAIPAAVMTLFGPAEALMTMVMNIIVMSLIGTILAMAIFNFAKLFAPEMAA